MGKNDTLSKPITFNAAILSALPDGVVVVDSENSVLFANPAAHALLNSKTVQLVGTKLGFRVRLSGPQELKLYSRNKLVVLEAKATQISFDDARAILISIRDITAHIRKTQEASKPIFTEHKKDEFLFVASHELKTPLTCLKAYNELVKMAVEEKNFEEAREHSEKVNTFVNRLTNITNDLLDASHMQSGKLAIKLQKLVLGNVMKECVETLRPIFRSHRISLTGCPEHEVLGDRMRLEQVLTNLVSNSVKFSPNANRVDIEIAEREKSVLVSVRDYGIGISHANIENLSSRFYRESNVQNKFEGLGLGLFIASQIVKRHHGKLTVESKEGEGSLFAFEIPIHVESSI